MSTLPMTATAPTSPMISLLSDSSFTQLVNDALRNYHSTLALSRSALANSSLVTPTLVKDEASPTAEERGHGLRLVLQWAVQQLAPTAAAYPLGVYRPLDDPTWRDPRWWRYNILRHRYLEPLHPDDFVGGGRYTESLLALTGISSADAFFDERNRAIRDVAERLRQQLIDDQAHEELQRLALQEATLPLEKQAEAAMLLGIAATFDDVFPRNLLIEMATHEQVYNLDLTLNAMIAQRFLLTGDEGTSLWLSPVLRNYVYRRLHKADRERRHRFVAAYYEAQNAPLPAARHWQLANQDAKAVRMLLPVVDELLHELHVKDLIVLFQKIEPKRLTHEQQYAVYLLLGDLFQRSGQHEDALSACRQALKATEDPTQQARIYRRMGKLYESRNQLHALRYYQQAVERFQPQDRELAELLKDRGWLYFYRQEWDRSNADLEQALQVAPEGAQTLRADIYDAMASLNREIGDHKRALAYAEQALFLREEEGDLMRIAKSHANLGLLYRAMGEPKHAIAAYQEAMITYHKIGNQEVIAIILLNIGAAYYLDQQIEEALGAYRQSLAISQTIDLPLIASKAHYNLAEALMACHCPKEALSHWQAGYQLCKQYNFDDLARDFLVLAETLQLLPTAEPTEREDSAAPVTISVTDQLDIDEEVVMALVRREHLLTPKRLMHAANISRATATRRLTALVEKGLLEKQGEGRATAYRLPVTRTSMPPASLATVTPAPQTELPAIEHLQARLQQQQQELQDEFAVDALTLLTPPTSLPLVRVRAQFTHPPDLAHYLQLKEYLSRLLQVEVDLVVGKP